MAHKQMNAIYRLFMRTSMLLFIAFGCVLLIHDRFRFWFVLISTLAVLRYFCNIIASGFVLPLIMKRTRISPRNKAVLITGCDTGFGNLLARRLDKIGFNVFACCLNPTENGGMELTSSCSSNLRTLKLDVTDHNSVEEAKEFLISNLGELELWAIVNNAGISRDTFIEMTSMKNFESVINVNLLGVVRVTKTFLPLIRKAKGRIVNVASAAGRFHLPAYAAYFVSKHAVITFSDILRMELNKFEVPVVTIEPWFYRTRLIDGEKINSYLDKSWSSSPNEVQESYGSKELAKHKYLVERLLPWLVSRNLNEVVDHMESAIMEEVPQYVYSPGRWYFGFFLWFLNSVVTSSARDLLIYKCMFGS